MLRRKGVIAVAAAFMLVVLFAFVALAVDSAMLVSEKTGMQNAADAAALAAATEISEAVRQSAAEASTPGFDVNSYAVARARQMAADVAEANGHYVDPDRDVKFGRRTQNEATGKWSVTWNSPPYNAVQVTVHRDQEDSSAPDGKVKLSFGWAVGHDSVGLKTSATAYVDARDMVVILDFSGSMNDDSTLHAIDKLGRSAVENNMEDIWEALGPPDLGNLDFTPQWLTLTSAPAQAGGPTATVTFKDTVARVEATATINQVKLYFYDGNTQTFSNLSVTSGDYQGSGNNYGEGVYKVQITLRTTTTTEGGMDPVRIKGAVPTSDNKPQIYVTFKGESIYVESSKDLSNVVLEFTDGTHYKFDGLSGKTGSFQGNGSNSGKWIKRAWIKSGSNSSDDGPGYGERFISPVSSPPSETINVDTVITLEDSNDNAKTAFGLNGVTYPYPSGSWDEFLNYCRGDSQVRGAGYKRQYGGLCFVNYLLTSKNEKTQCPDLWKTPHYPFHAIKEGVSLLANFLDDLDFGDELGIVSYDEAARVENYLNEDGETIDLTDDSITNRYADIDSIQRHKQAGHYAQYTAIGYGLKEARKLMYGDTAAGAEGHLRYGARPTVILMTDGQANRYPSGWKLPNSFDWDDWTDYDGDGAADYTTTDKAKQYAFWEATQLIKQGTTVHTLSVGADGDRDLMEAIAFAGDGITIDVPGGSTVAEMESQLLAAFGQIAGLVPAPKLTYENAE